ncbi:IS110 family transposase [Streptomyces calidiresistens]
MAAGCCRGANDEPELLELLTDVLALGNEVTRGIDPADGGAVLAMGILLNHDQLVNHISGRAVHRASESYRGEGKTDAKDAAVIADRVRIRRDLHPLSPGDETIIDLKIPTGRRVDPVADRTRTINRPRAQPAGLFPGPERDPDLTDKGPLTLLTGYQTATAIRLLGAKRPEARLRNRKVLRASRLAGSAVEAAERRHASLPAEKLTAQMVHTPAKEVLALNEQVTEFDKPIEARFRDHRHFEVLTGIPDPGLIPGAECLAATGGDMAVFGTPDPLASFGGAATGPARLRQDQRQAAMAQRHDRRLPRVLYTSALFSIRRSDESPRFYDRKRAEGKRHTQAVLALARRWVNALRALLRDGRCYELTPPTALAASQTALGILVGISCSGDTRRCISLVHTRHELKLSGRNLLRFSVMAAKWTRLLQCSHLLFEAR